VSPFASTHFHFVAFRCLISFFLLYQPESVIDVIKHAVVGLFKRAVPASSFDIAQVQKVSAPLALFETLSVLFVLSKL
jgi:hypothetical protein